MRTDGGSRHQRRDVEKDGRPKIVPKDEMREALGRSPDSGIPSVDALPRIHVTQKVQQRGASRLELSVLAKTNAKFMVFVRNLTPHWIQTIFQVSNLRDCASQRLAEFLRARRFVLPEFECYNLI